MWLIPTKKEVKKEIERIETSLKERDLIIKELFNKVENNSLKIATLEGLLLNRVNQSQSQSHTSGTHKNGTTGTIEKRIIEQVRKHKGSIIIAEILKLLENHNVLDTYKIIVEGRKLCSKSSYYRYIENLRKQQRLITL